MPILSWWERQRVEGGELTDWWDNAALEQKVSIVRLLNGETGIQWPFSVPMVRLWAKDRKRAQERIQLGLPAQKHVKDQVQDDRSIFVEHHRRVGQFQEWIGGVNLPPDIRRCRYAKCSRFFLVSPSRPGKVSCTARCKGNFKVGAFQNEKNRGIRRG